MAIPKRPSKMKLMAPPMKKKGGMKRAHIAEAIKLHKSPMGMDTKY